MDSAGGSRRRVWSVGQYVRVGVPPSVPEKDLEAWIEGGGGREGGRAAGHNCQLPASFSALLGGSTWV